MQSEHKHSILKSLLILLNFNHETSRVAFVAFYCASPATSIPVSWWPPLKMCAINFYILSARVASIKKAVKSRKTHKGNKSKKTKKLVCSGCEIKKDS